MSNGSAKTPRLTYRISPPDRRGILWHDKGWLFVVRTDGEGDPEAFLKTYLATIIAAERKP